jgi:tricorn protease
LSLFPAGVYCLDLDTLINRARCATIFFSTQKDRMSDGYYRFPTIHQDTIVFVSEDDLWSVARQGGVARRLTSNLGEVNYPALSPDGEWLAFVGREEGMPEVYLMPAAGGSARRMTYLNHTCQVLGWTPDGRHILFSTNYGHFHPQEFTIYTVAIDAAAGQVAPASVGPARTIAYGPDGGVVIGRNTGDPARWKRYRGGTAGHLWIDRTGEGAFDRFLPDLRGNLASPMWLSDADGGRIYLISDHEGIGNLYSVTPAGNDLRRHTDHADFYARNPSTDGTRIVYHAGADLYVYDSTVSQNVKVDVAYRSPRVQRNRKFSPAIAYLDSARLNPMGDALAVTTRGKAFTFFNHEGPVMQIGQRDGVRYRLPDFLNDDQYLVMVDDANGEEELVIFSADLAEAPRRLPGLDIGRPVALKVSPIEDKIALSNHRQELLIIDLKSGEVTRVDRSEWRPIAGMDWSPDGRWLAYGFGVGLNATEIRLYHLPDPQPTPEAGAEDNAKDSAAPDAARQTEQHPNPVAVTRPILHDVAPSFDPGGNYLYFLSYREFNPVYDNLHFDLSFPWGMRPYLLLLRADLPNPFLPRPDGDDEDDHEDDEDGDDHDGDDHDGDDHEHSDEHDGERDDDEDDDSESDDEDAAPVDDEWQRRHPSRRHPSRRDRREMTPSAARKPVSDEENHAANKANRHKRDDEKRKPRPVEIDLEGIERRILAFPLPDSRYGQIAGAPGRAIFTTYSLHGALDGEESWGDGEEEEGGSLRAWVFKDYKSEAIAENVATFELSRNRKKLLYFCGRRLRVIPATEKAPGDSGPGRRGGWIDLFRIKVSVAPPSEWEQMVREAWRLQRDHFWAEDMAEVDWHAVYARYHPLLDRVSSRSEFSDLVWEMQGELGTSHAYEFGGDYRPSPHYSQGVLGAEFVWDVAAGGYRIENIVEGDPWRAEATSPLAAPGVDVRVGDILLAVNGQRLDETTSPAQLLVNQAGQEVLLTLAPRPTETSASDAAASDVAPGIVPDAASEDEASPPKPELRAVIAKTIHNDEKARYRAWVEAKRRQVHEATAGRIGYVHIPDMGTHGYAEFHRGFLAEVMRDGLIVDVRYNSGGHVSQLLLEKLARRRIGYDAARWGGVAPYPSESVAGPRVALTNELAGSDGDIFCHSFKLLGLGPLIGKRTWGGVIGISPRHPLVDGTITTQPEYSFWFQDVGWMVENYGTDPDIEVEMTPQDYVAGRDPQLERAITEVLRLLVEQPIVKPDRSTRPSRALPRLPRRE